MVTGSLANPPVIAMSVVPEFTSCTVVIVGAFAPANFHPMWFVNNGLLGQKAVEADIEDDAKPLVVSTRRSQMNIAGFLIDVQASRLILQTDQQNLFEPLRDLTESVLNLHPAVSIDAVGMNFHYHYQTGSAAAWHRAGDRLAPKAIWQAAFPQQTSLGMNSLSIRIEREGATKGVLNVKVEPSALLQYGLFVEVNDHNDFVNGMSGIDVGEFVSTNWSTIYERATQIAGKVLEQVVRDES